MAAIPITSRYLKSFIVLDDGLLRPGRVTRFYTSPVPVEFVEREDTTRIKVRIRDRLDNIAVAFYGDPNLWWVIADFQPVPIMNPIFLEPGRELFVPSYEYVFSDILKRPA